MIFTRQELLALKRCIDLLRDAAKHGDMIVLSDAERIGLRSAVSKIEQERLPRG